MLASFIEILILDAIGKVSRAFVVAQILEG